MARCSSRYQLLPAVTRSDQRRLIVWPGTDALPTPAFRTTKPHPWHEGRGFRRTRSSHCQPHPACRRVITRRLPTTKPRPAVVNPWSSPDPPHAGTSAPLGCGRPCRESGATPAGDRGWPSWPPCGPRPPWSARLRTGALLLGARPPSGRRGSTTSIRFNGFGTDASFVCPAWFVHLVMPSLRRRHTSNPVIRVDAPHDGAGRRSQQGGIPCARVDYWFVAACIYKRR